LPIVPIPLSFGASADYIPSGISPWSLPEGN